MENQITQQQNMIESIKINPSEWAKDVDINDFLETLKMLKS